MPSQRFKMRIISRARKVVEFHGPADITAQRTDAIVNAANSSLLGGGGVDGAIHRLGGPVILEECKAYVSRHGTLPPGRAMVTSGGKLTAKYVIHAVGPIYRGGQYGERELLASCHRECIRLADEHHLRSVSFPAISTGAYGYPLHEAAAVAVSAVLDSLEGAQNVETVRFVLFDERAFKSYARAGENVLRERGRESYRVDKVIEPKSD